MKSLRKLINYMRDFEEQSMRKGILFDLDGTLWDATEQTVQVWNRTLLEESIDHRITMQQMKECMGLTIEEIAVRLLPNLTGDVIQSIVTECEKRECEYLETYGGTLYPNLTVTLEHLKDTYELYIVSNCQKGYIEAFLKYHKLSRLFSDFECSGNTNMKKTENISMVIARNEIDGCIYVGDTIGDYEAATEAEIPFVYAEYGFGEVLNAEYKIRAIEQLMEKVDGVFSAIT